MTQEARGTFEVKATREPPFDDSDGVVLGRTRFDKRFQGDLEATSRVEMLSAGTPTPGSAVYVALEKVSGRLGGREGSFALAHLGVMRRGAPTLAISVVPDSGTGGLAGLEGSFDIEIKDGQHFYTMRYTLPE